MKYKQTLTAGALAITGALAFGGLNVYAAEVTVTTFDQLRSCLAVNNNVCTLGSDFIPSSAEVVTVPDGISSQLDLAGYALGDPDVTTESNFGNLDIVVKGELAISNSTASGEVYGNIAVTAPTTHGKLTVDGDISFGGSLSQDVTTSNNPIAITIKRGTFNKDITVQTGDLTITGGTFKGSIYAETSAQLNISGGTFTEPIYSKDAASTVIAGGTFDDTVAFWGTGTNKISGGTFDSVQACIEANTTMEIAGGTFSNINTGNYAAGTKLTISKGTFQKGFYINVQELNITGGKFINGDNEGAGGFLALMLEHEDDQTYSITGGQFINVSDEYGELLTIFTSTKPTESAIRSLFGDGKVLDGCWIELAEDEALGGGYISYVKKARVDEPDDAAENEEEEDEDGVDVKVPDTGNNTSNGDNMSGTSIAVLVASVLAGSLALGAAAYFGLHKRVSFKK